MSDLDTRLFTGLYKVLDPLAHEDTLIEDTYTGKQAEESSIETAPVTDGGIFQSFYFKVGAPI